MSATDNQEHQSESLDRRRLVLSLLLTPVLISVLLFLPAGNLLWARAWLFVGAFLAAMALGTLYRWRVNPDIVSARVDRHRGTEQWDKSCWASSSQPGWPSCRLPLWMLIPGVW